MRTRTMTLDAFRALCGLTLGHVAAGCSLADYEMTEVTLYQDGSAAYTDGGVRVALDAEAQRAWDEHPARAGVG